MCSFIDETIVLFSPVTHTHSMFTLQFISNEFTYCVLGFRKFVGYANYLTEQRSIHLKFICCLACSYNHGDDISKLLWILTRFLLRFPSPCNMYNDDKCFMILTNCQTALPHSILHVLEFMYLSLPLYEYQIFL